MSFRAQTIWKGTIGLGLASVFCRFIGMVPRFYLPRLIGLEAIGLYQMSYPLLLLLLTLLCGGFPMVLARWTGQQMISTQDAVKLGSKWTSRIGLGCIITFFISVPWIVTNLYHDHRLIWPMLIVPWIVYLVMASSAWRGLALGKGQLTTGALAQTAEALLRVCISLWIGYEFGKQYPIEWTACALMGSVFVGEAASFLIWKFKFKQQHNQNEKINGSSAQLSMKKLFKESLPFTAQKVAGALAFWAESIWILYCLASFGVSHVAILSGYGVIQATLLPLIMFPGSISLSVATGLFSAIAQAKEDESKIEVVRMVRQSLAISWWTSIPFHTVMLLFTAPICAAIYGNQSYVQWMIMLLMFGFNVSLQSPLQNILQADGRASFAMWNTITGSIIKMMCMLVLPKLFDDPWIGIILSMGIGMTWTTACAFWQTRGWWGGKDIHPTDLIKLISGYAFLPFAWTLTDAFGTVYNRSMIIILVYTILMIVFYRGWLKQKIRLLKEKRLST